MCVHRCGRRRSRLVQEFVAQALFVVDHDGAGYAVRLRLCRLSPYQQCGPRLDNSNRDSGTRLETCRDTLCWCWFNGPVPSSCKVWHLRRVDPAKRRKPPNEAIEEHVEHSIERHGVDWWTPPGEFDLLAVQPSHEPKR